MNNPVGALEFALNHGINLTADLEETNASHVQLEKLDSAGATAQHFTEDGANYRYTQLNFLNDNDNLIAARKLAAIDVGSRTELAIWQQNAPYKHLSVHQGIGTLVVARLYSNKMRAFSLDPTITPTIMLPGGVAYTFEADEENFLPLVVSGMYSAEELEIDWAEMETAFAPGQTTVETQKGLVTVPSEFFARYSN